MSHLESVREEKRRDVHAYVNGARGKFNRSKLRIKLQFIIYRSETVTTNNRKGRALYESGSIYKCYLFKHFNK